MKLANCPAFLSAKFSNDTVSVKLCRFHSHKSEIFTTLNYQIKVAIEAKLRMGIPPKVSLEQIKKENPETIILIQDIMNIYNNLEINSTALNQNDLLSTSNI